MDKQFLNIWVVGPFYAGKSTFIGTLTDIAKDDYNTQLIHRQSYLATQYQEPISLEEASRFSRLLGTDISSVKVDEDLLLFIIGSTSARRFDLLYEFYSMNLVGIIFLADSSHPETFREFLSIKSTTLSYFTNVPHMIVANKQDKPDALSIAELQNMLHLELDSEIIPCVAHDKESVKNVVIELFNRVRTYD